MTVTAYRVDLRRLRIAMLDAGVLSVSALARLAGISRTRMANIASGAIPEPEVQSTISTVLKIQPSEVWSPVNLIERI